MDWIVNLFTNTESVAPSPTLRYRDSYWCLPRKDKDWRHFVGRHLRFSSPVFWLTRWLHRSKGNSHIRARLRIDPLRLHDWSPGGTLVSSRVSRKVVLRSTCFRLALFLLNILDVWLLYLFLTRATQTTCPMMVRYPLWCGYQYPGLGAANEALLSVFPNGAPSIANGYACAYPLGVVALSVLLSLSSTSVRLILLMRKNSLTKNAANPHAKAITYTCVKMLIFRQNALEVRVLEP